MDTLIERVPLPAGTFVPGLALRRIELARDLPAMVGVVDAARTAAGGHEAATLEGMTAQYTHLRNCDLDRDAVVAELDGRLAGYARVEWHDRTSGERAMDTVCNVDPAVRGRGIGGALFAWQAERLENLAGELAPSAPGRPIIAVGYVMGHDPGARSLLEQAGFELARQHCEMIRPDLTGIPDIAAPEGIAIRGIDPANEALVRRVFEVDEEVFSEHWGGDFDVSDAAYERFRANPQVQPELWQVAFSGDEIAGQILNYLDPPAADRSVIGWTESIAVRRPWRRRGVARALLAASLRRVRDAGATKAGLGVDEQNPNEARSLYESLGFRKTIEFLEFHRTLRTGGDR